MKRKHDIIAERQRYVTRRITVVGKNGKFEATVRFYGAWRKYAPWSSVVAR